MLYKRYREIENVLDDIFGGHIPSYLNYDMGERICADAPVGWDCSWGASKIVLIPENKNFVVKIPFKKDASYSDDYNEEAWESLPSFCSAYYPLSGTNGFDYCRSEAEYFKLAKRSGIAEFFAATIFIGTYNHYPIYIQEKINPAENDWKSHTHTPAERQKTRNTLASMNVYTDSIADDDLVEILQQHSKKKVKKFFDFLDHYHIRDVRPANYGYDSEGMVVLSDYSDFRE